MENTDKQYTDPEELEAIRAIGRIGESKSYIQIYDLPLPKDMYIRGPTYKITFDRLTEIDNK